MCGWIPPRGRGVPSLSFYPGRRGATPSCAGRAGFAFGRWSRWDRRRLKPAAWVPARSRAGIQAFSRESPDAKSRGGMPPAPPFFRARSFPLARFGGGITLLRSRSYYEPHVRALIWKLSFEKFFFSIFFLENASQIGLSIAEEIVLLSHQRQRSPKRANESERAMNPGVQGRSPGPLSPHFSGEMGTPAGQAGPPGRCAPRRLRSCPPTGYAVPAALGPRPHLPMETVSHFGNKPKTLSQQAGGYLDPNPLSQGA